MCKRCAKRRSFWHSFHRTAISAVYHFIQGLLRLAPGAWKLHGPSLSDSSPNLWQCQLKRHYPPKCPLARLCYSKSFDESPDFRSRDVPRIIGAPGWHTPTNNASHFEHPILIFPLLKIFLACYSPTSITANFWLLEFLEVISIWVLVTSGHSCLEAFSTVCFLLFFSFGFWRLLYKFYV